jgi:hypothetical protein
MMQIAFRISISQRALTLFALLMAVATTALLA